MKGIVVSSDSNRATQYKILKDAVPVFCAEKGYNGTMTTAPLLAIKLVF